MTPGNHQPIPTNGGSCKSSQILEYEENRKFTKEEPTGKEDVDPARLKILRVSNMMESRTSTHKNMITPVRAKSTESMLSM